MITINELILYRDAADGVLTRIAEVEGRVGELNNEALSEGARAALREELVTKYTGAVSTIIQSAVASGFSGNIWHSYLTYLLVYNENAYSKSCEIRGSVEGGINAAALHDFAIYRRLFGCRFEEIEKALGTELYAMLSDFTLAQDGRHTYNRRIRDRIEELQKKLAASEDDEAFKSAIDEFYHDFGCGKFAMHKAFRVVHRDGSGEVDIVPISNIAHVRLDDLVGYEIQKKKLRENTEAFLAGRSCNNCLLYGDAGTGKSSSIKGILNEYFGQGLRIIEIYKHQFKDLVDVIDQIKRRNYRFIIYMDDLSFEEFETDYKYLKAVIEGGLEKKPDNVLIYATSNRRHLIRENYADKEGDIRSDMHTSDTVQEKLSLSNRFGVTIYFGAPVKKEYDTIVTTLARQEDISMDPEKLCQLAGSWELSHGGRSGRTARQFIDYIKGTQKNAVSD